MRNLPKAITVPDRDLVLRLRQHVAARSAPLEIRLVQRLGVRVGLDRFSVIDEHADRNPRGDGGGVADVIVVVVRDQQVVQPGQAGLLHRGEHPIDIAIPVSRMPCVDQHRLAGRGDEERRLASFDVDEVDVERFLDLCARGGQGREEQGGDSGSNSHGGLLYRLSHWA
jgi:hypothetical protein